MRKTMMMVMMLKTMMTMMTVATNGNDRRPLFVCFAAVIIPTVVKKAKNHKFFCEPRLEHPARYTYYGCYDHACQQT